MAVAARSDCVKTPGAPRRALPEIWPKLLATFATAEAVAAETPANVRAALNANLAFADGFDDAALRAAIELARRHPRVSAIGRLPRSA